MNLHRFLMGYRWEELPAQSVLDLKVSKIIGTTLVVSIALNIAAAHTVAYQIRKPKETRN